MPGGNLLYGNPGYSDPGDWNDEENNNGIKHDQVSTSSVEASVTVGTDKNDDNGNGNLAAAVSEDVTWGCIAFIVGFLVIFGLGFLFGYTLR